MTFLSNSILRSLIFIGCSLPISAQEVALMNGVVPKPGDNQKTIVDKYKKKGPWKIGMSHFGLSNSWAVQMARESDYEASVHPNVAKFLFRDAGLSQAKQFLDIKDLVEQGIDALIVTPLTPTSAESGIQKAIAAGIPVIVHTGVTKSDAYTVDIQGGGNYFGRVMGDWLVKQLGGNGNIWVLRGVPSHPEDINRYQGLVDALKGSNVQIRLGGYGDWNYKGGKTLCEDLYRLNP
jgi:ribose transport system substrate-binding protein